MSSKETSLGKQAFSLVTTVMMFVAVAHSMFLQTTTAHADEPTPDSVRFTSATDKFDGAELISVNYDLPALQSLRAERTELSAGVVTTDLESRPFLSLGLVWQYPTYRARFFVEASIAPTVFAGSRIGGRDLGGNFHFTSSGSAGIRLGRNRQLTLALRIQHVSNGGLSSTNPGLDSVGITISHLAFN